MQIRNPYNGQFDYTLHPDNADSINHKSEQARLAQKEWQQAGIDYRVRVLGKWLDRLQVHQSSLLQQLSIDTGRNKIALTEVNAIRGLIQGWMYRAPQLFQLPTQRPSLTDAAVQVQQQWLPYPLVGVISPWNFPLLLSLIDTIPALLAGAAVLLKPSEVTPRFMDPLEQSIAEVPELAKVLQLARGAAETGQAIVQSVDAVCFTGSVLTGKIIAISCAQRLIPAFLELGGKDPAIVLADAHLDQATDAILRSCVGATGQACQSLERIYVDQSIFASFVERIVKKAKAVKLSTSPGQGQVGPIIFAQQAQKIQTQIEEAIAQGAQVHCGGQIEKINGGLWYRPTVLTNVNHQMKIMTEETFGPIIPIMSFQSIEEAIHLANDSIYGLSASVFSQNLDLSQQVAQQLEAGAISINDGSLTNKVYDAEKHAFKQSGINGSRMGDAGFLRFFRKKAILTQTAQPMTMDDFEESKE